MKIYIRATLPGASGVSGSLYTGGRGDLLAEARKQLTADVNACVEACVNSGADTVIVRDDDNNGGNILRSALHPAAGLLTGYVPGRILPEIEGFDGFIMIGCAAMAGTVGGVCSRTMSQYNVRNLFINGKRTGEIGFYAAAAAEKGVPLIMASGDDNACREAAEWGSQVKLCVVKKGMSENGALMPSLEYCRKLIAEKSAEAVKNISGTTASLISTPVKLQIEYLSSDVHFASESDSRISEGFGESLEEAWLNCR